MEKLDLRKSMKRLYSPSSKNVELVEVPELSFVMIDGIIEDNSGPGGSPAFKEALQALYGISYTLKFASKQHKENPIDYKVMALEALWWVAGEDFDITRPEGWRWTAMMVQPDHITPAMFTEAKSQLSRKRGTPSVEKLRFERFEEGLCMQIMHIGPYSTEPATVARMKQFAIDNGFNRSGRHHEIYLGDPLRSEPEKLKTILRQPVERV